MLKRLSVSQIATVALGLFVFGYAFLVSACIQLWIIPQLFSQAGAAEGLVVLDSIGFDQVAKAKAAEIAVSGWSAWELRPQWSFPAGVASAFYAVWKPLPLSMLPFNAVVHAVSACLMMIILRHFFPLMPAIAGALIFALNPTSLEWVAQIHRDGVFILGNLLFIFVLIRLYGGFTEFNRGGGRYFISLVFMAITGTLLVWLARTYWVQIQLATMLVTSIPLLIATVFRPTNQRKRNMAWLLMVLLIVAGFQMWLMKMDTQRVLLVSLPAQDSRALRPDLEPRHNTVQQANQDVRQETNRVDLSNIPWVRSGWLPIAIEQRLYTIATARAAAIYQGGNSLVDADRHLDSVGAMVEYIPRAFTLGLFSPFPDLWGGAGSTPAMTMARKLAGVVTLLSYFCLLGVVFGLIRNQRNLACWVMFVASIIGILFFAVTYPNVGTLIRFRYGFYMLLVGFGGAYWCDIWLKHKRVFGTAK